MGWVSGAGVGQRAGGQGRQRPTLNELFERGDFDAFERLGPPELASRRTLKWSRYGPEVLAAWVAEMDFPSASSVLEAISEALQREELGYPALDSQSGLPEAVARFQMRRFGWQVDPEWVRVVPDVLKGVELALRHLTPPGSPFVLPTPAYMPFFELPGVLGRQMVQVPTLVDPDGTRRLDYQAIAQALDQGAASVLLCNPYNPLGRCLEAEELARLGEVVSARSARVIADEIHAPLTYSPSRHVPYASLSAETAAHAVTMVSASKAWNLPGLRCAQVILTSEADRQRWGRISTLETHGASTLGIRASVAAYELGEPWLESALTYLDANRRLLGELLAHHLPEVGYRPPEATYLAWLDCRSLGLEQEPAEFFLRRAKVATNPGPAFGGDGPGHLRFNFATSQRVLEAMVEAMGDAVCAHRQGRRE